MSSVLFIKDADFSTNAVGKISVEKLVLSQSGSASEGEVSSTENSNQTRFWFPFVPTQGKKYKVIVHITNGSANPQTSVSLGATRFVVGSTDRTGQEFYSLSTSMVQNYEEYEVEAEVTCNGVYGYVYLNIIWDKDYPTKYPNFDLKLYELAE